MLIVKGELVGLTLVGVIPLTWMVYYDVSGYLSGEPEV